jgi:uncharacterized protein
MVSASNLVMETLDELLRRYQDELPLEFEHSVLGVNMRGFEGDTPLHVACIRDSIPDATLLIKSGADINARGDMGLTPIYSAISNGNFDLVKLLIECGADLEQKSEFGNSPVERARELANIPDRPVVRQEIAEHLARLSAERPAD